MSLIYKSLLAATVVLLSTIACRPKLAVGYDAPSLEVSRWVKGEGPSKLELGEVYVVEFWATWCGYCIDAIPHITQMAQNHKGKATFIGVNVLEGKGGAGKELENKVDSFVGEMGDKMDYLVARDTSADTMLKTWMYAAGEKGIPCVFVVDGAGKIAWIGHPMYGMDKAIDEVLAKAKA
jgi:thiol-disulfide isomerase/thioredoxin